MRPANINPAINVLTSPLLHGRTEGLRFSRKQASYLTHHISQALCLFHSDRSEIRERCYERLSDLMHAVSLLREEE